MKKVQNLRDYAARQRTDATLEAAMAENSAKFRPTDGYIYLHVIEIKGQSKT